MIHLSGENSTDILRIAQEEIAIMAEEGVDGIIIENYFGGTNDVRRILDEIDEYRGRLLIGINILGNNNMAFDLANEFPVDFIQIDSVCGHLNQSDDDLFKAGLDSRRAVFKGVLLGGVRFKYQPVRSGRSEQEDVILAATRADTLVVSGSGTGVEIDLAKLSRFRAILAENSTVTASVPLLIGSGLTVENAKLHLPHADGAIVGSFFKDTRVDTGRVYRPHVRQLMNIVQEIRAETRSAP